jgi:hypothetical protein
MLTAWGAARLITIGLPFLLLSGCLGAEFVLPDRPPHSGYVVRGEAIDEPSDASEAVYRFDELPGSEQRIVEDAIYSDRYIECIEGIDDNVSSAVKNVTDRFANAQGYVLKDGRYYDVNGGHYTHQC